MGILGGPGISTRGFGIAGMRTRQRFRSTLWRIGIRSTAANSVESVIGEADKALYQSKVDGRNRSTHFEDLHDGLRRECA